MHKKIVKATLLEGWLNMSDWLPASYKLLNTFNTSSSILLSRSCQTLPEGFSFLFLLLVLRKGKLHCYTLPWFSPVYFVFKVNNLSKSVRSSSWIHILVFFCFLLSTFLSTVIMINRIILTHHLTNCVILETVIRT